MQRLIMNRKVSKIQCSSDSKLSEASKAFRIKRVQTIKENLNKFIMLGSSDIKEVSDHIKELDLLHKEAIEGLMSRKTAKTSTSQSPTFSMKLDDLDDEDDIFRN